MEHRLSDINDTIAQNYYRIANIRAGDVYVISNIGAFGPGVIKVGLTRDSNPETGCKNWATRQSRSPTTSTPPSTPKTPSR